MGSIASCAFDEDPECLTCYPESSKEAESNEYLKKEMLKYRKMKRKKNKNLKIHQIQNTEKQSIFYSNVAIQAFDNEGQEDYKQETNSPTNTPSPPPMTICLPPNTTDDYQSISPIKNIDSMAFLLDFSTPIHTLETNASLEMIASNKSLNCSPVPVSSIMPLQPLTNSYSSEHSKSNIPPLHFIYSKHERRSLSFPYIPIMSTDPVKYRPPPRKQLMSVDKELEMTAARLKRLDNVNSPIDMENIIRHQYSIEIASDDDSISCNSSNNKSSNSNNCESERRGDDETGNTTSVVLQISDTDSDLSLTADREEIAIAVHKRDCENALQERKRAASYVKHDGSVRHLFRGLSVKQWEDEHVQKTVSDMQMAFDSLKKDCMDDGCGGYRTIAVGDSNSAINIDSDKDMEDIPALTMRKAKSELFRLTSNKKWSKSEMDRENDALQKQLAHLAMMSNRSRKEVFVDDVKSEVLSSNSSFINLNDDIY